MTMVVYVIFDPYFGEKLTDLPQNTPIWIVDSLKNTPVAKRIWGERPNDTYPNGITTFQPVSELEGILNVIREHHGDELDLKIIGTIQS